MPDCFAFESCEACRDEIVGCVEPCETHHYGAHWLQLVCLAELDYVTARHMSDYRRNYVPGGTYFFTVVTYHRRRILIDEMSRSYLHQAIAEIRGKWPFRIVAIVLLPDHWHTVWTLPHGDNRYSLRLRRIKEQFTRRYLESGGTELAQTESRMNHGLRGIWQKRFWEHTIEDEDDLKRCVDYVHWNPKKHGLVASVKDWPWSSFHRFVAAGEYTLDWGGQDPAPGFPAAEWE